MFLSPLLRRARRATPTPRTATATSGASEFFSWIRSHPDAKPYRAEPGRLRTQPDPGAAAVVAEAIACGDLTELVGPDGSILVWSHQARADGGYAWLEPEAAGLTLAAAARDWLSPRLDDHLLGKDAADAAWDLLLEFFAERYGLPARTMPGPMIVLSGPSVLGDRDVCQMLYDLAREGFEDVVSARGGVMIDYANL